MSFSDAGGSVVFGVAARRSPMFYREIGPIRRV
jgi:hypothetical protein